MLKLTDVTQALPRMKTGTDLTDALQILPKYDAHIREQDAATRLTALSELYRIYIPSSLSTEIYTKLYLALLRSLQKKGTKLAIQQSYQNAKAVRGQEYEGVLGGADSFTIIGSSGIGKSSAISRAISVISANGIIQVDEPYTQIIPALTVQCPFDCSVKGMLLEILRKIDEAIGSSYYSNALRVQATSDMLIGSVSQTSLNHVACPLHFCRLYSSSVPISGNGSPNLITAEEAVPTDAAIHLPPNALERSLAAYIAAVSHASLNIQQEIPTCRFLHSRLENTKYVSRRGQQRNMELLFQDFSAFYQGYSGNTLTQQWQLQKVFSGQRMIPHEVCMVAYLLDITVNDLAEFIIPEQSQSTRFDNEVQKFRANGMNYVQIAKQMNASYDSIKLIGKGTYSTRRKKATQAKSRKTKKHDWKYTDATLLPPVQAVIQQLTAATDEKPIRITLGLIERMLMLPDKTLIHCPKCKAHIEQHVISQHMHCEKLIIWAIRRLLQDGKPIHPTNIMKLTNLRKKDLITTLGLSDTASSSEIGGTLLKIIS